MGILKKIFGNTPPSKEETALAWVKTIDGMDDLAAIEFTTNQLSEHFRNSIFQDEINIQAIFKIDEKTHNIAERITTHFVNIEHISADLEERISNKIFLYHRQLFITYYHLIDSLKSSPEQPLHLLLARAMHNATQMIKWRFYNYQSAPANVWLQISSLYLLAEKNGLLNAKIQPYSEKEPLSLSTAYIHACMLGTLETMSLRCQQIELVSKMLLAWTTKISIDTEFDETKHLFYVDTMSDKPAKRVRNFTPDHTYRYWNFDSVNSLIELCLSLIEFNVLPKQPMMQELIRNKDAKTLLDILQTEWSRVDYKRQRRSEDRSKATVAVSTAYGLQEVCEQILNFEQIRLQVRGERKQPSEKSFEERLATHSISKNEPNIIFMDLGAGESTIVDQSSKGLGLVVSKHPHDVGIGMLIGISNREQKYSTKIGMIRSIKPINNHQLHLGVELLSNVAYCSKGQNTNFKKQASPTKGSSANNDTYFANTEFGGLTNFMITSFGSDPNDFYCLYLPKEQSISKQETLIIPKLQYTKGAIFKVNVLGEDMLIRFTKSLEHHGNWVRASFTTDIRNDNARS